MKEFPRMYSLVSELSVETTTIAAVVIKTRRTKFPNGNSKVSGDSEISAATRTPLLLNPAD